MLRFDDAMSKTATIEKPTGKKEEVKEVRIYCDCCGKEHLATRRGNKLIVTDKRHGRWHVVSIPLDK